MRTTVIYKSNAACLPTAGVKLACVTQEFSPQSVIKSELLDNLRVFEFELTEDEMAVIHGLNKNLR